MPTEVEQQVRKMATWELENMIKALEYVAVFNSDEENERLRAAKITLRERRKQARLAGLQRARRRR